MECGLGSILLNLCTLYILTVIIRLSGLRTPEEVECLKEKISHSLSVNAKYFIFYKSVEALE